MKRYISLAAGLLAAAFLLTGPALAQVPSISGPYNAPLSKVITLTAQGAGTVNGALSVNLASRGIMCVFNQSAHTGTPSTTFFLQAYDPVSNAYETLATSSAVTADSTPSALIVYPGIQTSSLSTGSTGFGVPVPRQYRVSATVAGTSPVVTATVSCGLLR